MEKLDIIIVDDHKLFREGLKILLKNLENVDNVWEAADGEIFLQMIRTYRPHVVLMDIEMPNINGVDATIKALEQYPEMKILALSMYSDEEYFQKMVDAFLIEMPKASATMPPSVHKYSLELEVCHKDGHLLWIEDTLSFLWDENGKPTSGLIKRLGMEVYVE